MHGFNLKFSIFFFECSKASLHTPGAFNTERKVANESYFGTRLCIVLQTELIDRLFIMIDRFIYRSATGVCQIYIY